MQVVARLSRSKKPNEINDESDARDATPTGVGRALHPPGHLAPRGARYLMCQLQKIGPTDEHL